MTKILMGLQSLLYGLIDWDPNDNSRPESDYGDGKDATTSLAKHGWLGQLGIVRCWLLPPEEAERRYKLREAVVQGLQANALREPDASNKLAVLTGPGGLWVDDKGRLLRPEVGGNMCFRRGRFYPDAMVERNRKMTPDDWAEGPNKGIAIPKMIPVDVVSYANDMDRLVDQLIENEGKLEGAKPLSYMALIAVGKKFYDNGFVEKRFRDTFKVGTGQKIFRTFEVDRRCPSYGLLERGQREPKAEGYVDLRSLDKEKLYKLYKDLPPTEEIPEDDIKTMLGDKTPTVRPIPGKDMANIALRTKNAFVKELMNDIATGKNEAVVNSFARLDSILVEVVRLRDGGKLAEGVAALKAIVTPVDPVAEATPVAEAAPAVEEAATAATKQGAKKGK